MPDFFSSSLQKHGDGTLRDRIRIERVLRKLSQRQAADRVGTTRHNWHCFEKGTGHMTLKSLQVIASALQMRASELLEGTEYDVPTEATSSPHERVPPE